MADVFISYSRKDQAVVARLADGLKRHGKTVWVDLNDIMPSAPWMVEITTAITEAEAVLFVISPDSVNSDVCRQELGKALELNKRLVPVVIRETAIDTVPAEIAQLNFVDCRAVAAAPDEPEDQAFQHALDQLIQALDTDIEAVHLHTRLLLRATEWEASGADSGRLLRGRQLDEAEGWLARDGESTPAPTPSQVQLIVASRRAAVQRQRRSVVVVSVVAIGLIGLTVFSVVQWRTAVVQRAQATSRADAAESLNSLQRDPPKALDLALAATDSASTNESQTALRSAVQASVLRAVLPAMPAALNAAHHAGDGTGGSGTVAFDRSGRYIAVQNTSAGVEVWRWGAHTGLGSTSHPYVLSMKGAHQVVFAPDGVSVLIVAPQGNPTNTVDSVLRWTWAGGPRTSVLQRNLPGAVLSQNGAVVATVSDAGVASALSVQTGQVLAAVQTGLTAPSVDLSPDGTLLDAWDLNGDVDVWHASGGTLVDHLSTGSVAALNKSGEFPVAISPDDARIAVAEENGIIGVDPLTSNGNPVTLTLAAPPGAPADGGGLFTVGSLAWSADSMDLAASGYDGAARVWSGDITSSSVPTYVGPEGDGGGGIAFSPDGAHVVNGNDVGEATVWAWKADTVWQIRAPAYIDAVAVSPRSDIIVFAAQNATLDHEVVTVWDWSRLQSETLATLPNSLTQPQVTFSPDGRWLALAADGKLTIWSMSSRQPVASAPLPAGELGGQFKFDRTGTVVGETFPADEGHTAMAVSWRWAADEPLARMPVLRMPPQDDLAINQVEPDGTVTFVLGSDYRSWSGRSSRASHVVEAGIAPTTGLVLVAAFVDGGRSVVEGVGDNPTRVSIVDLASGQRTPVLTQESIDGSVTASPDGRLLSAPINFGDDLIVWDRNAADEPTTIPVAVPGSTAVFGTGFLMIQESQTLFIIPDEYCGALSNVTDLARSLVVQPDAVATALSY
jgi:WD40 repeat protein